MPLLFPANRQLQPQTNQSNIPTFSINQWATNTKALLSCSPICIQQQTHQFVCSPYSSDFSKSHWTALKANKNPSRFCFLFCFWMCFPHSSKPVNIKLPLLRLHQHPDVSNKQNKLLTNKQHLSPIVHACAHQTSALKTMVLFTTFDT